MTRSVADSVPVPMLNLHVYRTQQQTPTHIAESTGEEVEGYFMLGRDAMSGFSAPASKMSFSEAIQYFIV